jgi:hypothetical protein
MKPRIVLLKILTVFQVLVLQLKSCDLVTGGRWGKEKIHIINCQKILWILKEYNSGDFLCESLRFDFFQFPIPITGEKWEIGGEI